VHSKYVQYHQVKNIELIPQRNEAVNIDGDVKNNTPVKISILEKKLPIFY
jgi:diacylglycerol kinase family enzyme